MPGLHLCRHVEAGAARDVDAGHRLASGLAQMLPHLSVQALPAARLHESVVGRMEFDHIEPAALPVETLEAWWMLVGEAAQLRHLTAAALGAKRGQALDSALATFPHHRFPQGAVRGEQVDVFERRALVRHLVGREARGHAPVSSADRFAM